MKKKVYLFSCNGGSPLYSSDSVAAQLSLKTSAIVRACAYSVSFDIGMSNKKYYAHSHCYLVNQYKDIKCSYSKKKNKYIFKISTTRSKFVNGILWAPGVFS